MFGIGTKLSDRAIIVNCNLQSRDSSRFEIDDLKMAVPLGDLTYRLVIINIFFLFFPNLNFFLLFFPFVFSIILSFLYYSLRFIFFLSYYLLFFFNPFYLFLLNKKKVSTGQGDQRKVFVVSIIFFFLLYSSVLFYLFLFYSFLIFPIFSNFFQGV